MVSEAKEWDVPQGVEEAVAAMRARSRRGQRIVAGFFGAIALIIVLFYPDGARDQRLAIGGLLVTAPVALWLLVASLRNRRDEVTLRLLRERGREVVWFFLQVGDPGSRGVVLRFADGTGTLIPGGDDALLTALTAALPHATVGFHPSLDAAFRAEPGSLRRA